MSTLWWVTYITLALVLYPVVAGIAWRSVFRPIGRLAGFGDDGFFLMALCSWLWPLALPLAVPVVVGGLLWTIFGWLGGYASGGWEFPERRR